ncbi:McrC family protein [Streptomyces scopuliridis]|uniref:Restriction endonuclease n=1 Tax=Streptomyces scopuliridis RB72 TaxID=1440053 RepID=A0A2T7T8E6_9ACTN|nr:hypothetical protein [Streptomyces scopuliridis]PVE11429.1 hypothetical protein Y717_04220 [Streptomyces scopuliridis RB72]
MSDEPPISLREADDWSSRPLTEEQARTLDASELVDVRPGRVTGEWRLRARNQVGAVRLGRGRGHVRLSIAPKMPVDRLMYLLGYAPDRLLWDEERQQIDVAARPDLLPAVAHAFSRASRRALRAGVLFGYREIEDTLPVLRGRLRGAAQLGRRPGLALPLEVTYDDHTADIPENRLLLGAVRRMLRVPGVIPVHRRELQGFAAQLDGVTPPVPGAPLPVWSPTRLNLRYRPALSLATLILRGSSYELEDGRTISVDGLLFRMWQVYEDFLCGALGEALERTVGGRAEPRDRDHHLDTGKGHVLKPDLVHYLPGADGVPVPSVVVDAKYKSGPARDDLYQMLAYCVRLGLTQGHLVYASGQEDVIRVPVAGGEIRLHRHALDLGVPHQELKSRIDGLAELIIRSRAEAESGRVGTA